MSAPSSRSWTDIVFTWTAVKPRIVVILAVVVAISDALAVNAMHVGWSAFIGLMFAVVLSISRRRGLAVVSLAVSLTMFSFVRWRGEAVFGGSTCPDAPIRVVGVVDTVSQSKTKRIATLFLRCAGGHDATVVVQMPPAWLPAELVDPGYVENEITVSVTGRVNRQRASAFPWDFNAQEYWRRLGITTVLSVGKPSSVCVLKSQPKTHAKIDSAVVVVRRRIVELHRKALGVQSGDLIASMVIGDRAASPNEQLSLKFRELGLSHIIAASGFNLTIVIAAVWWTVRLLTSSLWIINTSCLVAICGFTLLAGASPSVERAALMCLVLIVSRYCFRSLYLPASIACALIVSVLIKPAILLDVGFQLSYVVTIYIALGTARFTEVLRRWHVPVVIADALAVAIVAQASVLPLQMLYFWQLGLFGLLANLLVSPLVTPITILGFAASTLAAVGQPAFDVAALAIDRLASIPLELTLRIVDWLAANSSNKYACGPPLWASVALYYSSLLALLCTLPEGRNQSLRMRSLVCLSVWLLAFVALFYRYPLGRLTAICYGNASGLITNSRKAMIIGDAENPNLKRALLYLGVSSPVKDSDAGLTDHPCLVSTVDSQTNVMLRSGGKSILAIRDHRAFFSGDAKPCALKSQALVLKLGDDAEFTRVECLADLYGQSP